MKLVRAFALAMLLAAISVIPASAAPLSQGIPIEELTPIAAWFALSTFFIPPIIALLKRTVFKGWEDARKDVAVFAVCLFFGFVEVFVNGSLKLTDGDTRQIVNLVIVNMWLTVGAAFIWYKMFWNPSTIDGRISGVQ